MVKGGKTKGPRSKGIKNIAKRKKKTKQRPLILGWGVVWLDCWVFTKKKNHQKQQKSERKKREAMWKKTN